MFLESLFLQNFRSYQEKEISFSEGIVGVFGSNGQGKTNLLEAIHMVTQGYSHRTRKHGELFHWGENSLVLRGVGHSQTLDQVHALQLAKSGKNRIRKNGKEGTLLSAFFGTFAVVSLGPEDIELVQGGPALRRRFLDSLISQHNAEYLDHLRHYQRILKQRNFLLKQESMDEAVWDVITDELTTYGAKIVEERLRWLDDIRKFSCESYYTISQGKEELGLEYQCSFPMESDLKKAFLEKLASRRSREQAMHSTMYGPHKDDIFVTLKGHSLRDYGSQGQHRSASLALKLASASHLESHFGHSPILLLDDIFAELDLGRREALGALIKPGAQAFIASPHPEDIPFSLSQKIILS